MITCHICNREFKDVEAYKRHLFELQAHESKTTTFAEYAKKHGFTYVNYKGK